MLYFTYFMVKSISHKTTQSLRIIKIHRRPKCGQNSQEIDLRDLFNELDSEIKATKTNIKKWDYIVIKKFFHSQKNTPI